MYAMLLADRRVARANCPKETGELHALQVELDRVSVE